MLSTINIITAPTKEYAKNSSLTLVPIGGKNKATIKALEEYTTTGLIFDTAPLTKEPNMTAGTIYSHTLQPMTYSTLITLPRDLKLKTLGQPSFWTTQRASQEQALNVSTTASEHTAGLFLVHSLKRGLTYWELALHLMHKKQFLANIEDAINSPVDLPSQIARYQNTLKYARSKVDFVYGVGLYMSPSNMELQIGTIQDYNNKIVIANDVEGLSLGLNNGAKSEPTPPPRPTSPVRGTKTKQSLPEPDPTPRPTPAYRKQVHAYAKMHNLPQSWVDGICADRTGFERWRAARSKAQKIHQKQEVKRRSGWKQEHPNQSKEHFYLHPTRELLLPGNV